MTHVKISELEPNTTIDSFYLLKTAAARVSTSNKPYLAGKLADITGDVDFKIWDYSGPVGESDVGTIIKIRGDVSLYQNTVQIIVRKVRFTTYADDVDISAILPTAPIDTNASYCEILKLVDSLTDSDYKSICNEMLSRHGEMLKTLPAAKSVHHSFISGLLMHTRDMLRAADFFSKLYSETVDRNLLLTGTLLHDFAKEREFVVSECGIVNGYSVNGKLLGHPYMGALEISQVARQLHIPDEKSVLLQHMLLSHHGEPEFGAAVRPCCAESELLYHIDLIDSRMEIYREAFEEVPVGSFSQRIYALERAVYHHSAGNDERILYHAE